jgi:hypothetical protein
MSTPPISLLNEVVLRDRQKVYKGTINPQLNVDIYLQDRQV